MKFNKDEQIALIGTIIAHLLIILLLVFTVLTNAIPPEEQGGVLVNFGNVEEAGGLYEPEGGGLGDNFMQAEQLEVPDEGVLEPVEPESSKDESPLPKGDEVVTQNTEETIALEAKRKEEEKKKKEDAARIKEENRKKDEARKKEDREKEEARKKEAEKRKKEEERIRKENAINDRVAGAFGSGTGGGSGKGNTGNTGIGSGTGSQGSGTGTGNQGSPFGNSDQGANTGVGGTGSFSLAGRSIGPSGLPRPQYTIQEEGRIVINITVDSNGNVIMAEVGKGTNIDNGSMRTSALEAAKKAKFSTIQGTNNQNGTITYRYSLK